MAKPPGATLHLGGQAWAHPTLEPLLVDINTLTPFPGNPRRGDQEAITKSIRTHGLYAGVVAQTSTRHILVGNHRRHALVELDAERIPVTWVNVSDTQAADIVARDNRTSELGVSDEADLLALLNSLPSAMLTDVGYSDADLMILQARLDAESAFQVDATDMVDEFKTVSGLNVEDYRPETGVAFIKISFPTATAFKKFCSLVEKDALPLGTKLKGGAVVTGRRAYIKGVI